MACLVSQLQVGERVVAASLDRDLMVLIEAFTVEQDAPTDRAAPLLATEHLRSERGAVIPLEAGGEMPPVPVGAERWIHRRVGPGHDIVGKKGLVDPGQMHLGPMTAAVLSTVRTDRSAESVG